MAAAGGQSSRQSLMSRQIAELEQALGIDLLDRSSKPHSLSPEGSKLETEIREFQLRFSQVLSSLTNMKEPIIVGAGESLILWFLIPLLARNHPEHLGTVRFRNLRSDQIAKAISSSHIDLGIHHSQIRVSGAKSIPLPPIPYRVVGDPDFIPETIKKWSDLPPNGNIRVAALEGDGSTRKLVNKLCEAHPKGPQIGMECTSLPQVLEACRHGNFIGIVPETVANTATKFDLKLRALDDLKKNSIKLSLSYLQKNLSRSPALEQLLKIITA